MAPACALHGESDCLPRRFLAVFHNKLLRCITFVISASRHLMPGDELLNYSVCRDMSECADGVGAHACGTDVCWALMLGGWWVYITDSSLKLQD